MFQSPVPDESRINELVERRVESLLRERFGSLVTPRSVPETAIRPSADAGALLTGDGVTCDWTDAPGTGEAPVWDGTAWVPTDVATQAELDAVETALDSDIDAVELDLGALDQELEDLQDELSAHHHDARYSRYIADRTITTDAGASAAQDLTSITVSGNGVTPIIIEWGIPQVQTSGVAMQVIADIFDGAGGTGTRYARQGYSEPAAAVTVFPFYGATSRITFAGTRTFYLRLSSTAGTVDPIITSTQPVYLRARTAP